MNKLRQGQVKYTSDGVELVYPVGLMLALDETDAAKRQQEVSAAIDRGEHINGRNREHKTALMIAIERKSTVVAGQLLSLKADATLADRQGRTALMYAAMNGDV